MSYDSYTKKPVNPPGRERRNSYDAYPGRRNTNTNFEEIELGIVDSRPKLGDQEQDRFGSSFNLLEVRRAFIKKVYGIVGSELLLVTVIMAIFMFTPLRDNVYKNKDWKIISMVLGIVPLGIILILTCCPVEKVIRRWPLNITLLTVLALVEGVILGILSASYTFESIMLAVGLTAGTAVIVSIFAFSTKIDFTKCGGIICILLVFLLLFGIAFFFMFFCG